MIAILMATYNGEKYLMQQIDSIVNQTYRNWALYIRDDGSTDSTLQIIEMYEKKYNNIKIVRSTLNQKGAKWNFISLLSCVNADYYMFCDQDDVWLPNKIEETYRRIKEIERPDTPTLICCDLKVVDANLNEIYPSFWKYMKLPPNLLIKKKYAISCNLFTGCTMMFNNKAKEISLPVDDSFILHDYWIGLNVIAAGGDIFPILDKLILYRQHNDNVCGAKAIGKTFSYYWGKLVGLNKVVKDYREKYKQANAIFDNNISWTYFLINKIVYLCKR